MKIDVKGNFSSFLSYGIPLSSQWEKADFNKPKFLDMYYIIPVNSEFHIVKLEDKTEPILILDLEAYDFTKLLDGNRSLDDAIQQLCRKYSKISRNEITKVYYRLVELDLIIEGYYKKTGDFPDEYFLRQERQIRFFSHYETKKNNRFDYQNSLFKSKVLILGIGGTGSQALLLLVAAGIGNIVAVDFDEVEQSNLNRQLIFHDSDIGRSKARAAKERIEAFNPHINIETIHQKIGNVDELCELMNNVDICLCCADVPPILIRSKINKASINTGTPVIYGGIYADHINIGPLVIPGETGCYQCWNESRKQLDRNYEYYFDYILNEEAQKQTSIANVWLYGTTGASIAMGMGGIVMDVIRYISGYAPPKTLGKQLSMNLCSFEINEISWPKISTCPICSK